MPTNTSRRSLRFRSCWFCCPRCDASEGGHLTVRCWNAVTAEEVRRAPVRHRRLGFDLTWLQSAQKCAGILTTLEHLHQRRSDDHAIDVATQPLDLLAAADAEAGADRQRRECAHAIEVGEDLLRHGDVAAGGARHGDCVDEAFTSRT